MKYGAYKALKITDDFSVIDFVSDGEKGPISKRVTFTATGLENVYNLAFGDFGQNGDIDDSIISNNGDRNKILATIVGIVESYTEKYPERWIAFKGSTDERTRLYRMAVGLNLEELSIKFDIYGYVGDKIVPFVKNMEINAFFIKRKFA